jgi:hypothetical protein
MTIMARRARHNVPIGMNRALRSQPGAQQQSIRAGRRGEPFQRQAGAIAYHRGEC